MLFFGTLSSLNLPLPSFFHSLVLLFSIFPLTKSPVSPIPPSLILPAACFSHLLLSFPSHYLSLNVPLLTSFTFFVFFLTSSLSKSHPEPLSVHFFAGLPLHPSLILLFSPSFPTKSILSVSSPMHLSFTTSFSLSL